MIGEKEEGGGGSLLGILSKVACHPLKVATHQTTTERNTTTTIKFQHSFQKDHLL